MFHVSVRAISCEDNGNGTFTLKLPSQSLTEEQSKLLESLFPHTFNKMEDLLAAEALIEGIASEREVRAEKNMVRSCYTCGESYRTSINNGETKCEDCRIREAVAIEPVKKSVKQPLGKAFDDGLNKSV